MKKSKTNLISFLLRNLFAIKLITSREYLYHIRGKIGPNIICFLTSFTEKISKLFKKLSFITKMSMIRL